MEGRLGVLGGTFDPLHVGHRIVAQDVVERLELDRLLVIPAGRPPHRRAHLPTEARLRMVEAAFRGDDRIEASGVEVERSGPSYTVDTLEWIRRTVDPAELFCVIGVDQLRTFGSWREPGRIVELARLAVMTREGDAPGPGDAPEGIPYEVVPVTRVDVSGTRIRDRLDGGLTVRYLVPESIREELEAAWRELR